jgi:Ca2+/Na+ antiporter
VGLLLSFAVAVAVSLTASWLLVSRLERLGERAGLTEAWLGLVWALAADAPEITSAVAALARHLAGRGHGSRIASHRHQAAPRAGKAPENFPAGISLL